MLQSQRDEQNSGVMQSTEIQALRRENKDLERQLEIRAEDISRLENNIDVERKTVETLTKVGVQVMRRFCSTVTQEMKQIERSNKEAREKVLDLEENVKSLEEKLKIEDSRIATRRGDDEVHQKQLKEKNKQIESLFKAKQTLQQQKKEVDEENESIREELEGVFRALDAYVGGRAHLTHTT